MKLSKFLALIIVAVMILSLASCDNSHGHTPDTDDPHGGESSGGGNSPENQDPSEGNEGKITYICNVVTKSIHLPSCYHVDVKDKDRLIECYDISIKLGEGYVPCKDCLYIDDGNEDEGEEEDENLIAREDATFATNKASLTIHTLDCFMLESMSEKNLRYTNLGYSELIDADYQPCGHCLHEQYEQYKKDHPEKFE